MDTCATLASFKGPSAAGTPTTDLGRNRPTSDRVPFFTPLPILRSMTEAEEAVEEITTSNERDTLTIPESAPTTEAILEQAEEEVDW